LLEDCPGLAALKDPFNNKAGLVSLIACSRKLGSQRGRRHCLDDREQSQSMSRRSWKDFRLTQEAPSILLRWSLKLANGPHASPTLNSDLSGAGIGHIVLARAQDIEIGTTVNPKDDSFAINELICSTPRTTRRVLQTSQK